MSFNPWETGPLSLIPVGDAPAWPPGRPGILNLADAMGADAASVLLRLRLDQIDTEDMGSALHRLQPTGIVLACCRGLADLQAADVALGVIEAESGRPTGSMAVLPEFGGAPDAFLQTCRLAGGSPRLAAVLLNEDALAGAICLNPASVGATCAPLAHARARTVLQAADAGVPALLYLPASVTDAEALHRLRAAAKADGFHDVIAHGADQRAALDSA